MNDSSLTVNTLSRPPAFGGSLRASVLRRAPRGRGVASARGVRVSRANSWRVLPPSDRLGIRTGWHGSAWVFSLPFAHDGAKDPRGKNFVPAWTVWCGFRAAHRDQVLNFPWAAARFGQQSRSLRVPGPVVAGKLPRKPRAQPTVPDSPPNYGFVIDNRRCIGCHACTVACKSEHSDPIGVNKTWVSYIEKGTFPDVSREFHVMRCNHCADAPCVEICPTACLVTREDGIVDFDPGRCIGCKACMQACPYDAIVIHPDTGTATKCNFCSHRVDRGREPACVTVCPAEAIIAGDLNTSASRIARLVAHEEVSVRKPEKGTRPKLFYVDGDASALDPSGAALHTHTLWGSKAPDVATASQRTVSPQATDRGRPRRAYDIAQRHAGSWGWKVSAYLFTKSIAAGLFMVPAIAMLASPNPAGWVFDAFAVGIPIALFALAATGAFLVADLKRPERFLWVLLRPQWRSWLVRGAYIITAYGLFLPLWWLFGPSGGGVGARFFAALGLLLAAGTAAYTGWLFGQAKGRDLWQSPLVPVHLLVQAGATGAAVLLVAWGGSSSVLATTLLVLLLVNFGLIAQDVWGKHATADASRAARLMRTGDRRSWFYLGVVTGGHALPILLLFAGAGVGSLFSFFAALLALVGVAIYEHLWVQAPQRLPLA